MSTVELGDYSRNGLYQITDTSWDSNGTYIGRISRNWEGNIINIETVGIPTANERKQQPMSDSYRTFTAVYDGTCNECGNDIEQGDEIAYVDDVIVCEACFEDLTGGGE